MCMNEREKKFYNQNSIPKTSSFFFFFNLLVYLLFYFPNFIFQNPNLEFTGLGEDSLIDDEITPLEVPFESNFIFPVPF